MRCIRYLVTRDTVIVILLLAVAWLYAADYTKVKTWTTGDTITASGLNDDIDGIINTINDLENENVKSTAAIAYSKLDLSGSVVNSDIKSTAAIAQSKISNAARAIDAAKVDGFSAAAAAIANTICVLDSGANVPTNTVDTAAIENLAVTAGKIALNSITANQIATNGVGAAEIAAGAVGTSEIANGSIIAADIASNAVETAKIANDAVTAAKIANDAVTAAKIDSVFGSWASKSFDTVYLAATDGFVVARGYANSQTELAHLRGYTDGSNPPGTQRTEIRVLYQNIAQGYASGGSFTMPVRKGDYWKVFKSVLGSPITTLYWIPLGT